MNLEEKELEVETPLYLNWVNQVVKSFNGPTIEKFSVQFDLDDSCQFDIDNWVLFALQKRVKSLVMDFDGHDLGDLSEYNNYNFPDMGRITNHLLSLSPGFTSFDYLTNLRLVNVNVIGQVLEYFLTNCQFLEQLSVEYSDTLVNLKVPSISCKLKILEIFYCYKVKSIEISASNLVLFKYYGPKISMPFKNVKLPVEVYIGGDYCSHVINNFSKFSSYFSQLESLTFDMSHTMSIEDNIELAKFPVFSKVKQLVLKISTNYCQDLLVCAPLIESCPLLYKCVFELDWCFARLTRKQRKFTSRPHACLKVVELIGFVGRTNDVELAMYLVRSAVRLEKITFDTRNLIQIGTPMEFVDSKK